MWPISAVTWTCRQSVVPVPTATLWDLWDAPPDASRVPLGRRWCGGSAGVLIPQALQPKNSDLLTTVLHVVRRAKNLERRGIGCLPERGSALVRCSAEEALSMRRPTNAILRTAVFILGEIAWHFRATPDMASHLTFGAPRAINMTMRETRNQAFSSNGHPSFSFINFGT